MKLLLDTCAALFLWSGDERLPRKVTEALMNPENDLYFHQISYLEITIKSSLGKLEIKVPPGDLVARGLEAYRIEYARLGNGDIAGLEALPFHHRDPFDRLLISHALEKGLVLVTPDQMMAKYGVPVFW